MVYMKDEDDSPVDACFEGAPAILGYAGPFVRWNHRQEAADIHVQVGKSVFYRWANLHILALKCILWIHD